MPRTITVNTLVRRATGGPVMLGFDSCRAYWRCRVIGDLCMAPHPADRTRRDLGRSAGNGSIRVGGFDAASGAGGCSLSQKDTVRSQQQQLVSFV